MVVIIQVTGNPYSLHMETWELLPNPNGRSTWQAPATVPCCTQVVDINAAPTVRPPGFVLRIPSLTIFDAAHPSVADITLTTNELSEISSSIYEHLDGIV